MKHEVAGISVLSESKSKPTTLRKFYNFYGLRLFCVILFKYAAFKVSDMLSGLLPVKNLHSVSRICKRYGVKVFGTENINSREFISRLKEMQVDMVVSIASPQIFRKELLNTPPRGCINVHGAPLPKYRGMMPSFWMLLNGEKKGAVTVHYINEEVDSGDIILQREYDIEPGMTHHALLVKSKQLAAELLLDVVENIKKGQVVRKINDKRQATYYSFPGKEDLKLFFKRGGRLR